MSVQPAVLVETGDVVPKKSFEDAPSLVDHATTALEVVMLAINTLEIAGAVVSVVTTGGVVVP